MSLNLVPETFFQDELEQLETHILTQTNLFLTTKRVCYLEEVKASIDTYHNKLIGLKDSEEREALLKDLRQRIQNSYEVANIKA